MKPASEKEIQNALQMLIDVEPIYYGGLERVKEGSAKSLQEGIVHYMRDAFKGKLSVGLLGLIMTLIEVTSAPYSKEGGFAKGICEKMPIAQLVMMLEPSVRDKIFKEMEIEWLDFAFKEFTAESRKHFAGLLAEMHGEALNNSIDAEVKPETQVFVSNILQSILKKE